MHVTPYPWGSLERLNRQTLRALRVARRKVDRAVRTDRIASAIGSLLTCDARVLVKRIAIDHPPNPDARVVCVLPGARVSIEIDPALAGTALGRLLCRPVSLSPAGTP